MDEITLRPIGRVQSPRTEVMDDDWGGVESVLALDPARFTEEATRGLAGFSHVDVVFHFDRVSEEHVHLGARRPRGRADWEPVGIFAQRAKSRPNRLGVTTCDLVAVNGLQVAVRGLDAIDGTPILDLKPHVAEFQARGELRQPAWMTELMRGYW